MFAENFVYGDGRESAERDADRLGVRHHSEREFLVGLRNFGGDSPERVHVAKSADGSGPEDDRKDDPNVGDFAEADFGGEVDDIEKLAQ